MMISERERAAIEAIDAANALDPRLERDSEGEHPKELRYGQRMSARLARFAPEAGEALRLAARGQHLRRWEIEREGYPEGRVGYLRWRKDLGAHHAAQMAAILDELGYEEAFVARVGRLLRKQGLRSDPEVQRLEDVACLVFIEHYLEPFAASEYGEAKGRSKILEILQKTWPKMSPEAQRAALELELPVALRSLLLEALGAGEGAEPGAQGATLAAEGPAPRGPSRPRVEIHYCSQCRFVLRAAWLAQELLFTFGQELGELALVPGAGGIFELRVDGALLFSKAEEGRFPEAKELKQRLRDRIAPEMNLGHSDRPERQ